MIARQSDCAAAEMNALRWLEAEAHKDARDASAKTNCNEPMTSAEPAHERDNANGAATKTALHAGIHQDYGRALK